MSYMLKAFAAGCTLLAVLYTPAVAQPGELSGFSFLRLEPSARAAALGGSFGAVYDGDVNVLFYNPALLNEDVHRSLSLSYLNHVGGLNAGFAAYSRQIDRVGTVGAGLRFLSWGNMVGADDSGAETGSFGASDVALTLGVARPLTSRARYGINVHAIWSNVSSYSAAAIAADAGFAYHLPDARLTLSTSIHNAGVTLSSLGETSDRLPLDVRVGVSKRLQYVPLLISLTGYNLHDPGSGGGDGLVQDVLRHVALGGEFQFSDAFNVRFGYNHRRHEDLKMKSRLDLAGFGMGFGLKITRIRLDYAFNSWSSLGGLHQFTVRTTI